MVQYKTQHYVPQYYLRLFSPDGNTIWMVNLTKNECSRVAIRNVCAGNYFYGRDITLEKLFSQLEGHSASLLRKIIDSKSLTILSQNDLNELNLHILFQYGRTKYSKLTAIEFANHLLDIYKDTFESEILESSREKGADITRDDLDKYEINPESAFSIWWLTGILSAPLLSDLDRILLMNKSGTDFICSDNPVVLFNSFFNKKGEISTRGVASKGLQVIYPINSKLMIFMYDSDFYELNYIKSGSRILVHKNKDVQRLNGLQIINSDQFVFFEYDNMLSKVKTRYGELEERIREQKVDFANLDMSYFFISPSGYKYDLERLSFLKHKNTNEESGIRDRELKEKVSKFIDGVLRKEIRDKDAFLEFLGLEA